MTRIEVEGVDVSLGDTPVLDSVSLAVEPGEFVGLVGPNGAGKTTLIRAINGRLSPDSGAVWLGGDRVADLSARAVGRRAATVPQETAVSFEFEVRDVVEMGRHPHRSRLSAHDPGADLVEEALARTETAGLADRSITAVSGGERARVFLARALAQDAPALLLDEPTAGLDVRHGVRTLDLVRGLEGKTVLAAIHDLDLAARYCDRLVLLADGRIRAAGPPDAVLTREHVREAFGTDAAVARDPVTGAASVTPLPDRENREGRVHVVPGGAGASRVLGRLAAAGFAVTVGVAREGTVDREAARALGLDAVVAPPGTTIGDEERDAAAEMARRADATVLADVEVGPSNAANLDVAGAADSLVVVEDCPFEERNRAGPEAARRYRRLRERGRVTDSTGVLDAVTAELDAVGRATPR